MDDMTQRNDIPAGEERASFEPNEKWKGCLREWIAKPPAAAEGNRNSCAVSQSGDGRKLLPLYPMEWSLALAMLKNKNVFCYNKVFACTECQRCVLSDTMMSSII